MVNELIYRSFKGVDNIKEILESSPPMSPITSIDKAFSLMADCCLYGTVLVLVVFLSNETYGASPHIHFMTSENIDRS